MSADIINLERHRPAACIPEPVAPVERSGTSDRIELRRARIRIAQLESSLMEALRESATHWRRARNAERRLKELTSEGGERKSG